MLILTDSILWLWSWEWWQQEIPRASSSFLNFFLIPPPPLQLKRVFIALMGEREKTGCVGVVGGFRNKALPLGGGCVHAADGCSLRREALASHSSWDRGLSCCCCRLVTKSCSTLCEPMDCSCQAPLTMGFPRGEYWSRLSFPPPGDLPNPGIEPASPALAGGLFTSELAGKPLKSE